MGELVEVVENRSWRLYDKHGTVLYLTLEEHSVENNVRKCHVSLRYGEEAHRTKLSLDFMRVFIRILPLKYSRVRCSRPQTRVYESLKRELINHTSDAVASWSLCYNSKRRQQLSARWDLWAEFDVDELGGALLELEVERVERLSNWQVLKGEQPLFAWPPVHATL